MLFVAVVLIFVIRRLRWFTFILFGYVIFMQAGNDIVNARLEPRFAGDSMLTRVRIADFPKRSGSSVSMLVESLGDPRIPARSRIGWHEPTRAPEFGDIWEFELRLRRPRGNSNPGVFSLENWMFREKLHAAGYVVPGDRNRLIAANALSGVESFRRDFVSRLETSGGDSIPVLAAIGVGARHLISREQWDRYARTGTSHLMAISGLHIGLAAAASFGLFMLSFGLVRLRGNHLDRAVIVSATTAACYAMISGFAVPSQRAALMLGVAGLAFLCRRPAEPLRIVVQVAVLIYIIDPVSLMAPGFSLSFGAVLLLLWLTRSFWRPGPGLYVRKIVAMQFVLLMGLMPLTVLIFHRIAITAPLANLVVVPVFSFVTVPLTLASMFVQPVWQQAANLFLWLGGMSMQVIEWLIGMFANLPMANTPVSGVDGPDTIIFCLVLFPAIWVFLPTGWPGRRVAILGVIALLLHKPLAPPQGCFDTYVLDVGQGLSVFVQSRNHSLLFDTGKSYRGGGSAAEQFVLPFLQYRGIANINTLVVSHADDDHAGGVTALLRHFNVERILAGEGIPDAGLRAEPCREGQNWRVDGIDFRLLHPGADDALSGNDASCVLIISAGQHRAALTGDVEDAGERKVLQRISHENLTVALIPHHGSLTSSSPSFVNQLRPDYAIASAGYANRWGFPKERVVRRWEGSGAAVLDTASSGAISFRLCTDGGIKMLREERERRRRFWHDSAKL